ncbi:hybrid sensor histidine kinase/response regulator [uncultured Desulfuromusa sp.]|uniref:hybrid sensor histidine kinase/response regulator n=1 Tax=uncultured Desulfuromusa sp. TaxID=219183 RepID=UPI002AA65162|nr:hybrid sensor histidine kinase/response regulator [uncultured Desulfuromusa sp.]
MGRVERLSSDRYEAEQNKESQHFLTVATKDCGKVLIVEDEDELAELLEFNLAHRGFDVFVAKDGLEACRIMGKEEPDLILLDLMLPLLDGWEVCKMVRSHHDQRIAKTPIIVLSALGSTDDRIKGYDLGADLYLPKPYSIKEVVIKAQQLIAQHRERVQLTESLSSLQNLSELQDQWQQVLFHELRNQLALISGIAEHLQSSTADLSYDQSDELTGQIVDSSQYLGALADNYLLVKNMENNSEHLQSESIILHDLLTEVTLLFKLQALQKACDLEVICPEDLLLNLHATGLKIIISSLLDNALKYSLLDGNVVISVEKDDSHVWIEVQDDGPGIDDEDRNKVFDKFYRAVVTHEKAAGAGLGLYMARSLAEAMGGHLRLINNQLPGCCFQLQLPC